MHELPIKRDWGYGISACALISVTTICIIGPVSSIGVRAVLEQRPMTGGCAFVVRQGNKIRVGRGQVGMFILIALIIVSFFVADAIRYRERPQYRWSSSVVIGIAATLTSLIYRRCGWGEEWRLDEPPLTVATTYRGWPFPWWGWVGLDAWFVPGIYFFFNLLFWTFLAATISYLITFGQWWTQYETGELTRIVAVSILLVMAQITVALLFGGSGC